MDGPKCSICLINHPALKQIELLCQHRACEWCLQRIFVMAIDRDSHFPAQCCGKDLDKLSIYLPQDVRNAYLTKGNELSVPLYERRYCANGHCAEWLDPYIHQFDKATSVQYAICEACGIDCKTCLLCKTRILGELGDHRCDTKKIEIEKQLAKFSDYRICPACNHSVRLDCSCGTMTCPCGYHFCYTCGQKACDCAEIRCKAPLPPPYTPTRPYRFKFTGYIMSQTNTYQDDKNMSDMNAGEDEDENMAEQEVELPDDEYYEEDYDEGYDDYEEDYDY